MMHPMFPIYDRMVRDISGSIRIRLPLQWIFMTAPRPLYSLFDPTRHPITMYLREITRRVGLCCRPMHPRRRLIFTMIEPFMMPAGEYNYPTENCNTKWGVISSLMYPTIPVFYPIWSFPIDRRRRMWQTKPWSCMTCPRAIICTMYTNRPMYERGMHGQRCRPTNRRTRLFVS